MVFIGNIVIGSILIWLSILVGSEVEINAKDYSSETKNRSFLLDRS